MKDETKVILGILVFMCVFALCNAISEANINITINQVCEDDSRVFEND